MVSAEGLINSRAYYRRRDRTGIVIKASRHGDGSILCTVRFSQPDEDLTVRLEQLEILADQNWFADDSDDGNYLLSLLSLRQEAAALQLAYRYGKFVSLSSSRLEPMPHQVSVVDRAVRDLFPRYILADEVGLGKTIEAGMILKELQARQLAERVLIIPPASLTTQWRWEMANKFNELFRIISGDTIRDFKANDPEGNIWDSEDKVICSLQLLRRDDHRLAISNSLKRWDLVIFDEAHHLRAYRTNRKTKSYRLAEALSSDANALLLLTATPMQLEDYDLFSLVELVQPGMLRDHEQFRSSRREVNILNRAAKQLEEFHLLEGQERREAVRNLQRLGCIANPDEDLAVKLLQEDEYYRSKVAEQVRDRHVLSNVMVRNRKIAVGGFANREALTLGLRLSPAERRLYDDVTSYVRQRYKASRNSWAAGFVTVVYQKLVASSRNALVSALENRIRAVRDSRLIESRSREELLEEWREDEDLAAEQIMEMWTPEALQEMELLEDLLRKAREISEDSKLDRVKEALVQVFGEDSMEKVLIFVQFKATMRYLKDQLEEEGYSVCVFHGGQDTADKDRAVSDFRGSAQVMISTEAGGEGRNFQFCHLMINYDLPWNPMRIEQRIGRLDRIGQKRTVRIYNLAVADTLEGRILETLDKRIRVFEETVGGLDPILGNFEEIAEKLVLGELTPMQFERIEKQLETKVKEARDAEVKMNDMIMDTRSFRQDRANELMKREPPVRSEHLKDFVLRFLGQYPMFDRKQMRGEVCTIEMPRALQAEVQFRFSRYRGTFEWNVARENEGLDFFAFGHEMIDKIVDYCLHATRFDRRRGAARLNLQNLKRGTYLVKYCVASYLGVRGAKHQELLPVVVDGSSDYFRELSEMFASSGPRLFANMTVMPTDRVRSITESLDVEEMLGSAEIWAQVIAEEQIQSMEEMWDEVFHKQKKRLRWTYEGAMAPLKTDLEERQRTLDSVRGRGRDPSVIRMFEGQVNATQERMRELETKWREDLEQLENSREVTVDVRELFSMLVEIV